MSQSMRGNFANNGYFANPNHANSSANQSSSTPLARPCVEKAKEVHASVFSQNAEHKRSVVAAYFAPRAEFSDPLVRATGTHSVLQQYLFLTIFPDVTSTTRSITWSHFDSSHATTSATESSPRAELVVIDADVTFTLLPFLPAALGSLRMRVTSHFKFDASGRLVVHEDVWSLRELVAYTAGGALGVLYDALRDVNGRVSAFAMDHVLWMVGGARKTLFGVPKRTFSGIGFGLNLGGGSYSRNGKGT